MTNMNDNIPIKEYIERLLIEAEKRHDERYINQKDYNTYHNNLQREMKEQSERYPTRETVDGLKDRIVKLERWPWATVGIFAAIVAIIGAVGVIVTIAVSVMGSRG